MSTFIGIDPGLKGGIAVVDTYDGVYSFAKMPDTPLGIWKCIDSVCRGDDTNTYAVIEKVGGYVPIVRNGVTFGQPGSYMFKFGENYGHLIMALTVLGFTPGNNLTIVPPKSWQSMLGISPRSRKSGESAAQHKRKIKEVASKLFKGKSVKVTGQSADALMMAEYCRMIYADKADSKAQSVEITWD